MQVAVATSTWLGSINSADWLVRLFVCLWPQVSLSHLPPSLQDLKLRFAQLSGLNRSQHLLPALEHLALTACSAQDSQQFKVRCGNVGLGGAARVLCTTDRLLIPSTHDIPLTHAHVATADGLCECWFASLQKMRNRWVPNCSATVVCAHNTQAFLGRQRSLTTLHLESMAGLKDEHVAALAGLPTLTSLTIMAVPNQNTTNAALCALTTLTRLRKLVWHVGQWRSSFLTIVPVLAWLHLLNCYCRVPRPCHPQFLHRTWFTCL